MSRMGSSSDFRIIGGRYNKTGAVAILTGDFWLDKALEKLNLDLQQRIVVDALEEAAEKLVAPRARQLAPYDEDESDQPPSQRGKHLRDNIVVRRPTARALSKLRAGRPIAVRVVAGSRSSLGIQRGSKGFYPVHKELGHLVRVRGRFGGRGFNSVPAQPYLRPALYEQHERVKARVKRLIWKGVLRSAKKQRGDR